MTELYGLNIKEITLDEKLLSEVSERRRSFIGRVRTESGKKLCLAAGMLVRAFVGENEAEGINGKPFVPGGCEYSVSHSGDIAVIAVSEEKTGVDIELMDKQNIDSLAKRAMTAEEYRRICASPDKNECFYRFWTMKESYVKMTGEGFNSADPSQISVIGRADCLFHTEKFGEYMLSCCGKTDEVKNLRMLSLQELMKRI